MPEALGFLASGLVLLTFGMRAMLPMRLLAICSNLAFIGYGLSLDLTPVWALHGILLPLNLYRLHELHQRVRGGRGGARRRASLDRLRPLVARRRFAAGEVLFRKGEPARELFYILKGRVRLRGLEGSIAQSRSARGARPVRSGRRPDRHRHLRDRLRAAGGERQPSRCAPRAPSPQSHGAPAARSRELVPARRLGAQARRRSG